MGGPLPDGPSDPLAVVESLAATADAGLVASAGPRYFGFVVGGGLPAALAADWLASTWDQNAGLYILSPAAAVAEEIAAGWLVDLLELPAGTSVGFVTGATMANFTALAAARHAVLAKVGWDVERQGLQGAPQVTVVTHEGTHVTVYASLQMLGLGREGTGVRRIASDAQGRMRPDALREVLAGLDGPTIVCAQAGNVNSGAFDPFEEIVADRPRTRRVGPHRRRLRDLGGGRALAPIADARPRRRRFVVDRRAQVAQRAVRLRSRVRARRRCPPRGDDPGRRLLRRDGRGRARSVQLGAGVVPSRPRVRRARRAPVDRPVRPDRADRARLRAGPADGRAARAGSAGRDPERRGPEPGPRPLRGSGRASPPRPAMSGHAPSSTRSSATARSSSAGRRGPAMPRCGCRSRAGPRPRTTSTGRPPRSSPAPPRWTAPDSGRPRPWCHERGRRGGGGPGSPDAGGQRAGLVDIPVCR